MLQRYEVRPLWVVIVSRPAAAVECVPVINKLVSDEFARVHVVVRTKTIAQSLSNKIDAPIYLASGQRFAEHADSPAVQSLPEAAPARRSQRVPLRWLRG